jgi:hypothetical protein
VIVAAAPARHRPTLGIEQCDFAGRPRPQATDAGERQAESRRQRLDVLAPGRRRAEGQFVVVAAGEQAELGQRGIGAGGEGGARRQANDLGRQGALFTCGKCRRAGHRNVDNGAGHAASGPKRLLRFSALGRPDRRVVG